MPAKSKKQQRFMGMIHAFQTGDLKNPSPAIKKAAKSIDPDDAEHFASTKHKGLPEKVKKRKKKIMNENIISFSDFVLNEGSGNPECTCKDCGYEGKESKFVSVFRDKKRCPKCKSEKILMEKS